MVPQVLIIVSMSLGVVCSAYIDVMVHKNKNVFKFLYLKVTEDIKWFYSILLFPSVDNLIELKENTFGWPMGPELLLMV